MTTLLRQVPRIVERNVYGLVVVQKVKQQVAVVLYFPVGVKLLA